jgi:ribonuclease HI
MLKATVISDASFCAQTKAAGRAFWITIDGGERIKKSGKFKTTPKNPSQAELWAALNGLAIALSRNCEFVLLQTDCLQVVKLLKDKNSKYLKEIVTNISHDFQIATKHVKGHSVVQDKRSYVNRWCDKQAKIHMMEQREEIKKTSSVILEKV